MSRKNLDVKTKGEIMEKHPFGIICTLKEKTDKELFDSIFTAYPYKDIKTWEIRLDGLLEKELPSGIKTVLDIMPDMLDRKIILTFRPKDQGGDRVMSIDTRLHFWNSLPLELLGWICNKNYNVIVDFEIDLVKWYVENKEPFPFPLEKIGVSFHDLKGNNSINELVTMREEMESLPILAFMKVVTVAKKDDEASKIISLIKQYKGKKPIISFLMGEFGKETRINSLHWGAAGTYGYLPGRGQVAPGEYSIRELLEDRSVCDVLKI